MFVVIKIFISNLMLVKGVRSNGSEIDCWNNKGRKEKETKTNKEEILISFKLLEQQMNERSIRNYFTSTAW